MGQVRWIFIHLTRSLSHGRRRVDPDPIRRVSVTLSQDLRNRVLGHSYDFIRLRAVQRKGGAKTQNVTLRHRAGDHATLQHCRDDTRGDFVGRIKEDAIIAVLDQFDRA